jgi:putative oxidoreductase
MTATNPHALYRNRTLAFMSVYVALNVAAIVGVLDHLSPLARWVLAVAVALPIAGHIWAMLCWMRDSDEFIRALTAKRFIIAAGLAMACVSAWGFAEAYAHAPHAPGFVTYMLWCAFFGLVAPFVRTTA